MCQRVHARCACDVWRKANREFRIENRIARNQAKILHGIFVMCCAIGHDGGDGGFRTGSCGCRHGKDWRQALEYAECTTHLCDALPRFHHACAGCLCAIHCGTAAKGDYAVALVVYVELTRLLDVLDRWIWLHAIVNNALETGCIASSKERIEQAELSEHGIRHDENIFNALALDKLRQFFDAACSGEKLRLPPGHEIHRRC